MVFQVKAFLIMSKRTKQLSKNLKSHKKRIVRYRRHPFVVPVITFLVLFFITLAAFVSLGGQTIGPGDARFVNVYVDGQEQTLPTRARTVGDLLDRMNIKLGEKDVVEPGLDTEILEDNFKVNVYRARLATIEENGKSVTLLSIQEDPNKLAQEAGLTVYPEDQVVPLPPQAALREGIVGQQFTVDRAPVIPLSLYGNEISVRTRAATVGEALKQKGIILQPDDTIEPSLDAELTDKTTIKVTNKNKQIINVEETIPMPVEVTDDPNLPLGSKVVRTPGRPGKKVVTYELKLVDGKEAGRTAIQTISISEPVKQVESRGTKQVTLTGSKADWMAAAGISSGEYQYVDYIIGRESGWNPARVSANRCIGLGQRCNGQILISACPNWQTDPVCQLNHFSGYAKSRYGSWSGAYSFWQANHWW